MDMTATCIPDTDSIHCLLSENDDLGNILALDDYKLNYWSIDFKFKRAKYIRQKCYIELGYDDKLNVTIAGLPKKMGKYVNFENFNKGLTLLGDEKRKDNKLAYKHVKGGVILVNTDFTIK